MFWKNQTTHFKLNMSGSDTRTYEVTFCSRVAGWANTLFAKHPEWPFRRRKLAMMFKGLSGIFPETYSRNLLGLDRNCPTLQSKILACKFSNRNSYYVTNSARWHNDESES